MLKSILIGLDGSPYSHCALDLAIQWSRRFNALLVGLGIVDEPTVCQPEMVPIGASAFKKQSDESRLSRATRQVEQLLEQFSLRCASEGIASKVLEDVGEPYEQILCESHRYDLILLGKQTYFHFATQEEPCETLKAVLKNTPRPVVTVPEKLGKGSSIIVANDGSLQSARVLQAFQNSGLGISQEVHVVSVASTHIDAARHTDHAAEFLSFHDIKATPHPVASSGSPSKVLLEKVQDLHGGLLVMGAYGKSVIRDFFLGSVTRSLLKESPVPLFLYH